MVIQLTNDNHYVRVISSFKLLPKFDTNVVRPNRYPYYRKGLWFIPCSHDHLPGTTTPLAEGTSQFGGDLSSTFSGTY